MIRLLPVSAILLAAAIASPLVSAAQTPAPTATASATPAGAATGKTFAVDTNNFAYVPESLVVPVGATVVFTNSDPALHTVTADDKSFDSGDMTQGKTWSHTFTKAGTYRYGCTYHSLMHGTIVVKP